MIITNKIVIRGSARLTVIPTPLVDWRRASNEVMNYIAACWIDANGMGTDICSDGLVSVIISGKDVNDTNAIHVDVLADDIMEFDLNGKQWHATFPRTNLIPYRVIESSVEGATRLLKLIGTANEVGKKTSPVEAELLVEVTFDQCSSPYASYGSFETIMAKLHEQYTSYKSTGEYQPIF